MYAIYARYYYNQGTFGAKKDGQLWDGNGPMTFSSKESAEEWLSWPAEEKGRDINSCESFKDKNGQTRFCQMGVYFLNPGEHSRPDYKIVKLWKNIK